MSDDGFPCHQLAPALWCDRMGPGGFMGHTCQMPGLISMTGGSSDPLSHVDERRFWPVDLGTPDYRAALYELERAYVRLLDAGRQRIIDLDGLVDPLDDMVARDPALRAARHVLAR